MRAGTSYERYGAIAHTVECGRKVANQAITNFLHVDNAATAFLQALSWPDGSVNISDNEPAPSLVWLPEYARELGAPTPPRNAEPDLITKLVSNQVALDLGWRLAHPS